MNIENMTEREMIEIEKHWCENCCNWDKEKIQMDGYSECKLTGTSVFGQEYGGNCKCFNIPAENVIVPPCKVGQAVWLIKSLNWQCTEWEIKEGKISMIQQKADKSWKFRITENHSVQDYTVDSIGKTVFLTKEEAEAALCKLQASYQQVRKDEGIHNDR